MDIKTRNRLITSGWTENRRIALDRIQESYRKIGLNMPESVADFLTQYGGLIFTDSSRDEDVKFLPEIAIGENLDKEYFERLLEEYEIYEPLYPLGVMCRGNLIIVMTEGGTFYGYTDGYLEKAGDSIEEMLDCIVGECTEAEVLE